MVVWWNADETVHLVLTALSVWTVRNACHKHNHNGRRLKDSERMNKQLSQLNHTTQLATWCYQITEHLSARHVKQIRLLASLWNVNMYMCYLHIHIVQTHVCECVKFYWKLSKPQTAVIQVCLYMERKWGWLNYHWKMLHWTVGLSGSNSVHAS